VSSKTAGEENSFMPHSVQSAKQNRWLILAHCFNMDGRAASQTITDRIPFWLAKGIVPIVLSAPIGRLDDRFPHYQIYSAAPSGLLFELRHIISQRFASTAMQKALKALLTLLLLPFYLVEILFIHLDSHWSWFLSAAVKGAWIISRHKPGLVYSSAGPTSSHLAALLLSKIFRLPWLAEVHDPLIVEGDKKGQFFYFKKWLEKMICRHADAVIYFTHQALESAQARNGRRCRGHVLRPGAEPPHLTVPAYRQRAKLHLAHFGSLAEDRNLETVLAAFAQLLRQQPQYSDKICLDIYGAELDPVSSAALAKWHLEDVVNLHGRLEYDPRTGKSGRQRVLEEMYRSDLLLLIHGEGSACAEYVPSKLYEYLLTGRPVLGLAEKGSELDILLRQNGHCSIGCKDREALVQVLREKLADWEENGLAGCDRPSPFTVQNAVGQIAEIVAEITEDRQHGP